MKSIIAAALLSFAIAGCTSFCSGKKYHYTEGPTRLKVTATERFAMVGKPWHHNLHIQGKLPAGQICMLQGFTQDELTFQSVGVFPDTGKRVLQYNITFSQQWWLEQSRELDLPDIYKENPQLYDPDYPLDIDGDDRWDEFARIRYVMRCVDPNTGETTRTQTKYKVKVSCPMCTI